MIHPRDLMNAMKAHRQSSQVWMRLGYLNRYKAEFKLSANTPASCYLLGHVNQFLGNICMLGVGSVELEVEAAAPRVEGQL